MSGRIGECIFLDSVRLKLITKFIAGDINLVLSL
jgi:hypothetical protein